MFVYPRTAALPEKRPRTGSFAFGPDRQLSPKTTPRSVCGDAAQRSTSHIPVIVISADATPGQVKRLCDAGAYDYLTKPIDVKRFLDLLSKVLKEREHSYE